MNETDREFPEPVTEDLTDARRWNRVSPNPVKEQELTEFIDRGKRSIRRVRRGQAAAAAAAEKKAHQVLTPSQDVVTFDKHGLPTELQPKNGMVVTGFRRTPQGLKRLTPEEMTPPPRPESAAISATVSEPAPEAPNKGFFARIPVIGKLFGG